MAEFDYTENSLFRLGVIAGRLQVLHEALEVFDSGMPDSTGDVLVREIIDRQTALGRWMMQTEEEALAEHQMLTDEIAAKVGCSNS